MKAGKGHEKFKCIVLVIIDQVLVRIPCKQRDFVLNFFISKYEIHTIKTLFTSTIDLLGVLKNNTYHVYILISQFNHELYQKVHPT